MWTSTSEARRRGAGWGRPRFRRLPDWPVPRALEPGDCRRIVDEFAVAARRCRQADFDVLNVHGAHGYLIHSFLSPLSNQRDDEYGGDRAGRMRLALEVAEAVRSEWPSDRPIFYRLSCIDDLPGGWDLDDTLVLVSELGRCLASTSSTARHRG